MVKGLDKFREYFSGYTDQYVLIGGAACDISFCEHDADFRATRDLDIVLIVEAQTKEFGEKIWEFIKDGKYTNRAKSNGRPQFYRFEKPQEPGFPLMLELFARMDWILGNDSVLTPIYIDDSVSSLSAILLDDAYYETLLAGRDVVNGVSILRPAWITEWNFEPVELLLAVKDDMRKFVSELQVSDVELKNLKILGIHESDIKQRLAEVYNI